jgi:hypothetical protein
MAARSWWKRWARNSAKTIRGKSGRRQASAPLKVEALEDRSVPTVIYNPAFGAETLIKTPNNDNNYQTLSSPTVFLIFWGQYWGTTIGTQQESSLALDAFAVLRSHYLSQLNQYGSDGNAFYGAAWIDTSSNSNRNGNSNSAIQNEIAYAINHSNGAISAPPSGATQLTSPIYAVIGDPNNSPGNGGFNVNGTYTPSGGSAIPINMIFAGTGGGTAGIDEFSFGLTFSHEMAERMTDPTNDTNGVEVSPPARLPANLLVTGTPQIGDFEPEPNNQAHYAYRVNSAGISVVVQPYWSNADQAYIVPDGNSQTVTLSPIWTVDSKGSASFSNQYDLTVTGDQGGVRNDVVTIDGTAASTTVVLNGESFAFDAGRIRKITLKMGIGSNTVNVKDVAAGQQVFVVGGGSDTVNIGSAGSVQGILGPVDVKDPPSFTALNIDDSTDRKARTLSITSGAVTGLAPATITYAQSDLSALNVMTGTGNNNRVSILSTPNNFFGVTTSLTSHGTDRVTVGNAGNVQGIHGVLILTNPPSHDDLTIDDSTDPTPRNVTIDAPVLPDGFQYGILTGLAPGTIEYRAIDMKSPVKILTGTGGNTVNVYRTPGEIATSLIGHGPDTVNIGLFGSVQGILGAVNISNPPDFTAVNVDDSTDMTGRTVTITNAQITGLAPGAINYAQSDLRSLNIQVGSGGSTMHVLSTPNHTQPGFVTTSLSSQDADTVLVGNAGNVQGIQGNLIVTNPPDRDWLTVDDSADTIGRAAVLDAVTPAGDTTYGTISGLSPGMIEYRAADMNSPVHILAGAGSDTITVRNTAPVGVQLDTGAGTNSVTVLGTGAPVTINAQGLQDAVRVGDASHNINSVTAPVTVNGDGSTMLTMDDTGNLPAALGGSVYIPEFTQFSVQSGSPQSPPAGVLTRVAWDLAIPPVGPPMPQSFASTINYQSLSGLTIDGGPAPNYYQIDSSSGTSTAGIAVNAGSTDYVTFGEPQGTVDAISGVTVTGNGNTAMTINDQGSTGNEEYDVYSDHFTREPITSPPSGPTQFIDYTGLASLALNGGTGEDIMGVFGTMAQTSVSLASSHGPVGGRTQFIVENAADTLDDIHGPVAIHGSNIFDFAQIIDQLNTVAHTYTLAGGSVQRSDLAPITYDGIGEMIFASAHNPFTPPGPNTVNVIGTSAGVLTQVVVNNGDVVTLGAPVGNSTLHSLQNFAGEVIVQSLATDAATVSIDDSGSTDTTARTVTLDQTAGLYRIAGMTPVAAPIDLRVGTGSQVTVTGDSADETFAIRALPSGMNIRINGGGGVNTLDYAGFTGDVTANLRLGTATGFDGGISGIRNVTGSIGNDMLVGDDLNNDLIGGSGRNIVIGGGGADTLTGGAGDNILIGGTTDYDSDGGALQTIWQEWLRTDVDFATRISDLTNGVGPNNVHLTAQTVHGDGAQDILNGGGQNWFFVSLNEDVVNNQQPGDVITPI